MPDWKKWEKLSRDSLNLDTCLQGCGCAERGRFNCQCIKKDELNWKNDFLYTRKFSPPPVRPVNKNGAMVLHPDGYVMGPYLYSEWLASGFELFDTCHEIINGEKDPDWSKLFFRHEDDFYGGIYSSFYEIFLLMIHKMESIEAKHGVTNDLTRGVNLYETIKAKEFNKPNTFRGKGEMYLIPKVHKEFATEIHKMDPSKIDVAGHQARLLNVSKEFKNRPKLMRKQNKKRTWQQAFHFLPKENQNFDSWYPVIKQTPVWWDLKTKKWSYPPIFENDPKIIDSQEELLEKTIENWLASGAIFLIDEKDIDLCTPLVIANVQLPNRPPPDPTKKPRVCHDGGFEKSVETFSFPCKLDDLATAQKIIAQFSLLSKTDDKRGFHLVKLALESRGLTVFEYKGRYLAYRVALFGSPTIPAIFQRANMVVVNYCRVVFGININLYLDDRLMIDYEDTMIDNVPMNAYVSTAMIIAAGGMISIKKSDFEPKYIQEFLGLTLNTKICEISVPGHKWKRFLEMVTKFIKQGFCTFKELEKLRGICVSFILTNPMTKLFIRHMNAKIAYLNSCIGTSTHTKVILEGDLLEELKEWINLDYLQMRHIWKDELNPILPGFKLSFTDSSSFSASAVVFNDDGSTVTKQWFFAEDVQPLPIYYKEGLAILWMLITFPEDFRKKRISHFCDNQNIVMAYKNLGARAPLLNEIITKIYRQLHDLEATLTMHWISTDYQLADESSRFINYNEEYLPKSFFEKIVVGLNVRPQVDLFASQANAKCDQWINFGPTNHKSCLGFDFFCHNPARLKGKILYAFPPKNIIDKAIYHLTRYYKHHKVMLIMHVFNEWPPATPQLIQIGAKMQKLESPCTVIPAEFQLEIDGHMHYGFYNNKPKATYLCSWNI